MILHADPSWPNRYVGAPYEDVGRGPEAFDCWGLVQHVYWAELGIALPSYAGDYVCSSEHAELGALIGQECNESTWRKVQDCQPFDLALFRQGRHASHIGIVVTDKLMLHMAHGLQASIEPWDAGRWAPRLLGTYRHNAASLGDAP